MSLRFRQVLSLVLSGAVLTGVVLPPGLGHRHAGAVHPHHHEGKGSQADDRSDHGHHSHHHSHPDRVESGLAAHAGGKFHVHYQIFGLDLTLPAPQQRENSGDQPRDQRTELVRLMNDPSPIPERLSRIGDRVFADRPRRFFDASTALTPIPAPSPPITSPPLCETARHERSGVQLA